jgi:hypothetical protein
LEAGKVKVEAMEEGQEKEDMWEGYDFHLEWYNKVLHMFETASLLDQSASMM